MDSSDLKRIKFQDFHGAYEQLGTELDEAYHRFMRSGWFVLGEETRSFEFEYAEFCEAEHCVGVSTGLDALHLALRAAGISKGDEVLVASNTYIATWLAVTQVGAVVVPVEPCEVSFNIDPDLIEEAITSKTRAILATNLYGRPCDYERISEIAREHGLRFLVDNAQAQGARFNGRVVGGLADMECHSFYPSKNLGAFGEAGAVTTNDAESAEAVRLLRNYGSRVRYENEVVGFNCRIDELQAAFLRVKLRHLHEWNNRRRQVATFYQGHLAPKAGLELPASCSRASSVWHLYVIRHEYRDQLKRRLDGLGVDTLIHYPTPPHRSGAYSEAKDEVLRRRDLPIADSLAQTVLSLPIDPFIQEEHLSAVAGRLEEALNELERSTDPESASGS